MSSPFGPVHRSSRCLLNHVEISTDLSRTLRKLKYVLLVDSDFVRHHLPHAATPLHAMKVRGHETIKSKGLLQCCLQLIYRQRFIRVC